MAASRVNASIAKQFLAGLASWAAGLVIFPHPASAIFFLAGLWLVRKSLTRRFGQVTENKAYKRLKLPSDWKTHQSYPVPGHGDVDIYVVAPDGRRFAIEVKSHRKVKFSKGLFGMGSGLKFHGAKPPKDPIKQAIGAAAALKAIPIIWFPLAESSARYHMTSPVEHFVVLGTHRHVRKAMGLGFWFL